MDTSRYMALFLSEVEENLRRFEALILKFMETRPTREDIDDAFRCIHTIKGMSFSMNFPRLADFCHAVEDSLETWRRGHLEFRQPYIAVLLFALDQMEAARQAVARNEEPQVDFAGLTDRILAYRQGRFEALYEKGGHSSDPSDVSGVRFSLDTSSTGTPLPLAAFGTGKDALIKVKAAILDDLLDTTADLFLIQGRLAEEQRVKGTEENPLIRELGVVSRRLYETVSQARLMPVKAVIQSMKRMLDALAKKLGKQVEVRFLGEDLELDRSVLDELAEPLIHLLRNAVDHGIESPGERLMAGKDATGLIEVQLAREGGIVSVVVADDGRGISWEAVSAKAVDLGLLTSSDLESMEERHVENLIFLPGFSTRASASNEVSGRGVGLDSASVKIASLGGTLTVATEHGHGTRFHIKVPYSVAVLWGILVRARGVNFIIPGALVDRTIQIHLRELADPLRIALGPERNETVPIRHLREALGLGTGVESLFDRVTVVVVNVHNRLAALAVDEVMLHEEVVIKPLEEPLNHLPYYSGIGLRANGGMALVLNPPAFFAESLTGGSEQ